MKKRGLIIIFFLILLATSIQANNINFKSKQITEEFHPGEEIEFELELTNNDPNEKQVTIGLDSISSEIVKEIRFTPSLMPITLNAQQSEFLKVVFKTSEKLIANQNYLIVLNIETIDQESLVKGEIIITPTPFENTVGVEVLTVEDIVPKEGNSFEIRLTHRGEQGIEQATLKLESLLFSEEKTIDLESYKTIELDIPVDIDESTTPGVYELTVMVLDGKQVVGKSMTGFRIIAHPNIKEVEKTEEGILSKTVVITKTNQGNTELKTIHEITLTRIQKLFTYTLPKPTSITRREGNYVYKWDFTVSPGNSYIIRITRDYKALLAIIFLIIVTLFVINAWKKSGVIIKKELKKDRDGIKIILTIKNNLSKPAKNITVADVVPGVMHPTKEYGSAKPSKVEKVDKGVRLTWNIHHLAKKEERIFSYKIEPKVHIIGTLGMPTATVKYVHKNQEKTNRSNKLFMVKK